MGRACFLGSERSEGLESLRKAFEWFRARGDLDRMIEIATLPGYLHPGEPGSIRFFEELLPCVPPDSPALGLTLYSYGMIQFNNLGDYAGAEETISKAMVLGRKAGDRDLEAKSLTALGFIDGRFLRFEAAREKADRAGALLRGSKDLYAITQYAILSYTVLVDLGCPEEAAPFLDRWIELSFRSRDSFGIGAAFFSRSRIDLLSGGWEAARRRIDEGLAAAPDHVFLLSCRCFLEYLVGDFEAGDAFRKRLADLHGRTPPGPYTAHIHTASTAIARALQSGDPRMAAVFIPLLRGIAEKPGAHPFILFRARLLLALAAAAASDEAAARQAYRDIRRLPGLCMVRPYRMERALGLAAHAYGDHATAAEHLRGALRWARHYRDRPAEAWILCELGEALASTSSGAEELKEAERSLSESREAALRLGMPPLAARTQAKIGNLAALLERGRPDHAHLSGRELEILGLIAEGMTNKAIALRLRISAYTVGNHMRNVLSKTGAANRTEAVVFARRRGLLE